MFTKSLAGSVTSAGAIAKSATRTLAGSTGPAGSLGNDPVVQDAVIESGGDTLAVGGFAPFAAALALAAPDPGSSRIQVSVVPANEVAWGTTSETFLAEGFGFTWQETFGDTGTGTVVLSNDDPALAAIGYDSALCFYLDGVRVFVALVESIDTETIAPTEEVDQTTTLAGRGAIAALDDVAVYPEGGADHLPVGDDRIFFFGQAVYDDSGWTNATVQATYFDATPNWNDVDGNKAPRDFPDAGAGYIWNSLGNVNDAPQGTVYFRYTFNLPGAIKIKFYASGDNLWALWLDGAQIMGEGEDGTTWLDTQVSAVIDISAGNHIMAARVTNTAPFVDGAGTHPNPAFLIVAAYAVNGSDGSETLVFHTDGFWRVTGYLDNAPPITAGQIMSTLRSEAATRGCFVPDITFSDTNDSDGAAWTPLYEFTVPIGDSWLGVLKSLTDTYVDFRLRYGSFTLDMWNISGHLYLSPTVLVSGYVDAVNANLTELRHTGNGVPGGPLGGQLQLPSISSHTIYHAPPGKNLIPVAGSNPAQRLG